MKQLYSDLLDQLDQEILPFDQAPLESVEVISKNITTCLQLIRELKHLYLNANHNQQEQIIFFKLIKPQFVSELFYQRDLLQYYQAKPVEPNKEVTLLIVLLTAQLSCHLRLFSG